MINGVVGNTLVSAGAVAYLGAFTALYRKQLIADWVKKCRELNIPVSDDFDLITNITLPNQVCIEYGYNFINFFQGIVFS